MDNEFVEKLKAISVYKKISEDEDQFDFSAAGIVNLQKRDLCPRKRYNLLPITTLYQNLKNVACFDNPCQADVIYIISIIIL